MIECFMNILNGFLLVVLYFHFFSVVLKKGVFDDLLLVLFAELPSA